MTRKVKASMPKFNTFISTFRVRVFLVEAFVKSRRAGSRRAYLGVLFEGPASSAQVSDLFIATTGKHAKFTIDAITSDWTLFYVISRFKKVPTDQRPLCTYNV